MKKLEKKSIIQTTSLTTQNSNNMIGPPLFWHVTELISQLQNSQQGIIRY